MPEREAAPADLAGDDSGDEVAGDDEEDVDADEAAGSELEACVVEDDEQDGDRAHAVDVGAVARARMRRVLHQRATRWSIEGPKSRDFPRREGAAGPGRSLALHGGAMGGRGGRCDLPVRSEPERPLARAGAPPRDDARLRSSPWASNSWAGTIPQYVTGNRRGAGRPFSSRASGVGVHHHPHGELAPAHVALPHARRRALRDSSPAGHHATSVLAACPQHTCSSSCLLRIATGAARAQRGRGRDSSACTRSTSSPSRGWPSARTCSAPASVCSPSGPTARTRVGPTLRALPRGGVAFFVLSLMSKPMLVTLPVVLLLRRRTGPWLGPLDMRASCCEKLPLLLALGSCSARSPCWDNTARARSRPGERFTLRAPARQRTALLRGVPGAARRGP